MPNAEFSGRPKAGPLERRVMLLIEHEEGKHDER